MLRHDRSLDRGRPSGPLRVLALAPLAVVAVLGLGGGAAHGRQQETPPGDAAPGGFRLLSQVPQEAAALLAVKPATLAARPELRSLLDGADPISRIAGGIDLPDADLDEFAVVELRRQEGGRPGPISPDLFLIRAVEPLGEEAVREVLGDFETVAFLGSSYDRSRSDGLVAYRPDDRTLILTPEEQEIRYLIAGRNRTGVAPLWAEAAEQAGDGQLLVAFETPWLVQRLDPSGPRPGPGPVDPIALVGPMLDRAYAYAVSVDVIGGARVGAVALCIDEEGAGRVAETASALKTLARNALGALRSRVEAPPDAAEAIGAAIDEADALLVATEIVAEGTTVRLRAESDLQLADLVRIASPPIAATRFSARRQQAMNNLKQIGLAMHNYHDTFGSFPPPVLYSDNGTPYSWRVALLPFLEQAPLYNEYRFDEPWDGPNNRAFLERMPAVFDVPGSDNDPTHADYFALVGPDTLMGEPGTGTSIADITDGTSNTMMIVESKRPVPWTRPEDIPVPAERTDPNAPLPELGGFWPDGFQAVFGDGAVRFVKDSLDRMVLRALITRNGGEAIASDSF